MYYKHKQWLEDASLDDKILSLRVRMRDKREEIWYLEQGIKKQLHILSIYRNSLHRANIEYNQMDLDLALIDGRFKVCKPKINPPKSRKKKEKLDLMAKVKAALSPGEILKLIDELRRMK